MGYLTQMARNGVLMLAVMWSSQNNSVQQASDNYNGVEAELRRAARLME